MGAATVLLDKALAPDLLAAVPRFGATVPFTAPTAYRAMVEAARTAGLVAAQGSTLRKCVSADETDARPGATGRVVPGYRALGVDEQMPAVPIGEVGRLAVRGPTGCGYLDDARQQP